MRPRCCIEKHEQSALRTTHAPLRAHIYHPARPKLMSHTLLRVFKITLTALASFIPQNRLQRRSENKAHVLQHTLKHLQMVTFMHLGYFSASH